MNRSRQILLASAAAAAMAAAAAGQNIAFNNFGPNFAYDPGLPAAAVWGPGAGDYTHGILFTSRGTGGISDIHMALNHDGGVNDFIVTMREDAFGEPGAIIGTWDNVEAVNVNEVVHIRADGSVNLAEGREYWLVVTGNSNARGLWRRNNIGDPGTRAWSTDGGQSWRLFSTERYAFRVTLDGAAQCYPDCDGNGVLDFFDFLCFQNAFLNQDPYADCDENGVFDFFDFLCFQNAFLAGCP
jgi:hypothetical protein